MRRPGSVSTISASEISASFTHDAHTLEEYVQISLGPHYHQIINKIGQLLLSGQEVTILDVGCGNGHALLDISNLFRSQHTLTCVGYDIQEQKISDIVYKKVDIASPDIPEKDFGKFSIIISVNVLPYVANKKLALSNIQRLLHPEYGQAFISVEPFYFGPQGCRMFDDCKTITWDENYRNLLIQAGNGKGIMKNYKCCPVPKKLLLRHHQDKESDSHYPTLIVPNFVTSEQSSRLTHKHRIGRLMCYGVHWVFEWINVKTPNPSGDEQIMGSPQHQPFKFAAPSFWLLAKDAQGKDKSLIHFLLNPGNWDESMKNPDWQPSTQFKQIVHHIAPELLSRKNAQTVEDLLPVEQPVPSLLKISVTAVMLILVLSYVIKMMNQLTQSMVEDPSHDSKLG